MIQHNTGKKNTTLKKFSVQSFPVMPVSFQQQFLQYRMILQKTWIGVLKKCFLLSISYKQCFRAAICTYQIFDLLYIHMMCTTHNEFTVTPCQDIIWQITHTPPQCMWSEWALSTYTWALSEPSDRGCFQQTRTPVSLKADGFCLWCAPAPPGHPKTSFVGTARRPNWLAARTQRSGGSGVEPHWAALAWLYAWLLGQSTDKTAKHK